VLRSRFPGVPIHSDVRDYVPVRGGADVYFVSFPCTGTSGAGKRTGLEHPESGLWYESLRCVVAGRPRFVVVEQPEGFIYRGLRGVLGGLRVAGYACEVEIVSAAELGAPHRRNRVFVVAYADDLCLERREGWCGWAERVGDDVAIARSFGCGAEAESGGLWLDDGVPAWLDGVGFDGWWGCNPPPFGSGVGRRVGGRRECVSLYGRSIVPLQAVVPLLRLRFLLGLLSGAGL